MALNVIILAAGEGSRMRSALPKVLHPLAGRPLIEHVIAAARALEPARIHVVYGHCGEQVRERLAHLDLGWVEQAERLGTGHAVQQVMPALSPEDTVIVLYGDVPLTRSETLTRLIDEIRDSDLALVTTSLDDPTGYGRIVRDAGGRVMRIVEEKDADGEHRAIREINTGILAAKAGSLDRWLTRLDNSNAQGEYYLTDVTEIAVADGVAPKTVSPRCTEEILGVNNRAQLAVLERYYQQCEAGRLMLEGVTLLDPMRFDLRGELSVGTDVVIDVNVVFEGEVTLGDGVTIGPNSVIRNARIGDGTRIEANCVIEEAQIGPRCCVGPFTRVRPETRLDEGVHLGNFVEIKKSSIGGGSKINHLSYVGDATVGRDVNIGAGTITCNYDGASKHHTEIGDHVFIGSDTQLIAPVRIGAGATIGAGSTISRDAPPNELTLSRARQETRKGWKRPTKQKTG